MHNNMTYIVSYVCDFNIWTGFVVSFDYKDEIAQGTCTSIIPDSQPDHIYAVRRTCTSGSSQTCDAVCSTIGYGTYLINI